MASQYRLLDGPLSDSQLSDLAALFAREWWSTGRDIDEVRGIVDNSQVVVGVVDADTERLVAFARVVTDFSVFAVILDVIVDESIRGAGLGRQLMDAIFVDPRLQALRGIGLQCRPDLIPFYEKWGFSIKEVTPEASLQLTRRFDRDNGEIPASIVASARS